MASLGSRTLSPCEGKVSWCAGGGLMLLGGQQPGCPWVVQPSRRVLLALLHLQSDSKGRALWPGGLRGEQSGTAPGLGKGGLIPGDSVGRVTPGDVSATLCSRGVRLRVQKAAGWLGNAQRPSPDLGSLWGRGQAEALGWEGRLPADLLLPSPQLREPTVTEPLLSQRSAVTQKPRQLLSVPCCAGPRARESLDC